MPTAELVPTSDQAVVGSTSTPLERLVAGWLLGFASDNTRAAYRRDAVAWLAFCRTVKLDPLEARRAHVDAWARTLEAASSSPATVARKLAAVSSWYSWLLAEDVLTGASPLSHVRRPRVSDESMTLGPDRDEACALLFSADQLGPKYAALISLLLLNGLRVSEAVGLDVDDINVERGHRVVRVRRKGGKIALVPIAPRTSDAIDTYLDGRTVGPIFLGDRRGRRGTGRLTPSGASYIVRRVAKHAGITKQLSPHSLRHGFVTLALEIGVALTDVQDAAGHADPRTTRRYDRARHRLDAAPTYALAAALA